MSEETPRTPVDELLDRGEENGCLEFSEIAELVEETGLDEERTEALYAEAQRRGITLSEDCSAQREESESTEGTYTPELFADATSDSLQIFLRDISQRRLLTAAEEVELAKRIERGDQAAKNRMIEANLRLVVANAKRYRGRGSASRWPPPGAGWPRSCGSSRPGRRARSAWPAPPPRRRSAAGAARCHAGRSGASRSWRRRTARACRCPPCSRSPRAAPSS